ncbi:MAG TPA: phytanoyl-CoA dioxygenase family protein, partial [Microlunatus sp.]|nr:phytanoyl-CoA dioxygenase family protein [Microlunatus sp.]
MTTTQTSRHLLDHDQVRFFDENGYLVLRDRIPADLVDDLRRATAEWMDQGRHQAGPPGEEGDFKFAFRDGHEVMFRVDYVHSKGSAVSLQLLGSPHVLGIAESLAGPNFVPTYESLVFKAEGDGAPIEWHQDAVHPRNHRIFNVDIYLDDSIAGEGALRVVPGSHRAAADICALTDTAGWDLPGAIEVEMRPGDVLVHDTMIVHGSPATQGNRLRRTLYYEFRPAEQILVEGPWDAGWVDARLRLVPLGLRAYADRQAARGEAAEPYRWRVDESL